MKNLIIILVAVVALSSCHKKEEQCKTDFMISSQNFKNITRELAEDYEQQIISIDEYESGMRREIYIYSEQLRVINQRPKCEGIVPQSTFDYLEMLKLSL